MFAKKIIGVTAVAVALAGLTVGSAAFAEGKGKSA